MKYLFTLLPVLVAKQQGRAPTIPKIIADVTVAVAVMF